MTRRDAGKYAALRAKLDASRGKHYWRTLDELAETDEFREYIGREFPVQASEWSKGTSRREFLKLMAASLALAGVNAGCTREPEEKILPYVRTPEGIVPGKPLYFATAMPLCGLGYGLLVESHMGRPIKIDGNPEHPASLGAVDPFRQASILGLYDPDRSQVIRAQGRIGARDTFVSSLLSRLIGLRQNAGRGLRILTEAVSSPTLIRQMSQLLEQLPEARWHQWEPTLLGASEIGAGIAFGDENRTVNTIYQLDRADVVLSLDANFFEIGPNPVPYPRGFMARRMLSVAPGSPAMNRLYVVETTHTITGAKADHRWPVRSAQLRAFAYALAAELGVAVEAPQGLAEHGVPPEALAAIADDLRNYRTSADGASLVIAGDHLPPDVQALTHAINATLGNVGRTVRYTEPVLADAPLGVESLRTLVEEMRAGDVDTLIMLGGNPAFTAPADLDFAAALENVGFSVHLGLELNETAVNSTWHLPETHFLESWSDVRAFDGTASIIQPLIAPLYDGAWSVHGVMSLLLGQPAVSDYEQVRATWQPLVEGDDFEDAWRRALHAGVIPGTAAAPAEVAVREDLPAAIGEAVAEEEGEAYELVLRPDPNIWDGRFANNGWLQELPKPLTTLTWDNAALISPDTADLLEVESGMLLEVEHDGRRLTLPVLLLAGLPLRSITLYFGYGRTRAGRVGKGLGFDAYRLRTAANPTFARVSARPVPGEYPLATVQRHFLMEGRDLVRSGTFDEFQEHPAAPPFVAAHEPEHRPSLLPEYDYSDVPRWAMVVNQTTCIGCNACVIGCQSENNIPIVGKEQVLNSREMHWLVIQTYFEGDFDNPRTYFQPKPCMHCEKAPCEIVCPVAATSHSYDGLNEMTYNRCIGTRYCSNNCPYKVRRFNYLDYTEPLRQHPSLQLLPNPDVTVRTRGVMEKCTYCVQRIRGAEIEAQKEGRPILPGEVRTACQEACPTEAIVFGDLNQPESPVTPLRAHSLNYELLGHLNTQPRTTYLAAVTNPNPRIAVGEPHDAAH